MQKSKFLALLGILAVLAALVGCPVQEDEGNETPAQTQTTSSSDDSSSSSSSTSSDDSSLSSSSSLLDDSSSSSLSSGDDSSSSDDNHQVQAPALSEFVGSWVSSYGDTYVVTETRVFSYISQNTFGTPFWTWDIVDSTGDVTNDKVLYVYGQVTQLGSTADGLAYDAGGTVGHYSVVYLEKVDADTIKICSAYNNDDHTSDNESLDYVKTNFTYENHYLGNKDSHTDYNKTITFRDFVGTWNNAGAGDSYVITETQFKNYYSADTSITPTCTWNICGVEADVTDDSIYYIYGQITQLGYSVYGGVEYPSNGTIGHYSAAYVKKTSDTIMLISSAYYDNSSDNASLDYVKANFTEGNGAYSYKPEYTKQ